MDKPAAIFDMDGTLIDSMVYWKQLAASYLESKGISQLPPGLMEAIKPMTMTESATLFIQEFALPGTPEEIAAEMNARMDEHYRRDIPLKPGVYAYLHALQQRGVRMCAASATAEHLMNACFERLGILQYFSFVLSCETVGAGKNKPDVYFAAAKQLGSAPADTAVYEDALYAATTAKEAGFYVVGVYDESACHHWKKMTQLADETIRSFQEERI